MTIKTGKSIATFLVLAVMGGGMASSLAFAQPNKPAYSAASSRRVVEIRYVGLTNLTPRDLEGVLPFSPGDAWQDQLVETTRKSLGEYYAKRGYYQAKIKVSSSFLKDHGVVVAIRVEEGKACVIRSLWIDDPSGFKSKSVMLRFKARMARVVNISPNDRYDEQILADKLRELREWLVAEDYILANTDNVRLTFDETNSQVDVVLAVDYGERVTLGFQGNTVFTKGELTEFIAQVRATGLGKDYVGAIQRRFTEEYVSRAYADVKIEARMSERPLSKHVTLIIKEGPRSEIQELKWDGLSGENIAAAHSVFSRSVSRLVQRGYFVEKDIEKGIMLVLEDLKARGYLSAKLVAKSVIAVKAPPHMKRLRVLVQLSDGEQTLVGRINLEGFTFYTNENIASIMNVGEKKEFNPFAFEEGLQRLRSAYLNEGYLDFKILSSDEEVVRFSENNRTANVSVRAFEGLRIKIGEVRINGLQKTNQYVVERELTVKTDDWWIGPKVQETETNLMKLGIFTEAKVTQTPSGKGPEYRDMIVELKEAEPGVLEVGPGFRSDLGARAFARVSYNNMLGKNWIGVLSAESNRRLDDEYRFIEYKFDASFSEPRFFGTLNQYSIGLSTKKQRFPPDFNAVTTTFTNGFERKLTSIISTKLFYKLERIRQFDVFFQNRLSAIDNRSMLIGSIVPAFTLDTRDSPFTTTQGWLATGSLEYAHPQLSGQAVHDFGAPGYQKWTASIHRYTPITKDIVWSKVVAGGFARSNIAGREIPLIKLFRLGGYSTIRGFSEDTINVDEVSILGTLTFLNLRTQVDLPLVGDLKFSPFLDAGNLYIDRVRGHPFFRAGAGVGLHYMTPVGPINLDWGHKLNPVEGESPNQFHFSVGLI